MREKEKLEGESKFSFKELVGHFSSWLPKAKKVVEDFFSKPNVFSNEEGEAFEADFDPGDYVALYYPEIDAAVFGEVSELIKSLEYKENGVVQIEGGKLRIEMEKLFKGRKGSAELAENYCIYDFIMRCALKKMLELRPDDHFNVLDVGGGPTVYQHIPLASVSRRIVHSEYLASNRSFVDEWISGGGYNWSSYVSCGQAGLSNFPDSYASASSEVKEKIDRLTSADVEEFSNHLRSVLTEVLPVDVFSPDLRQRETDFDIVNVSKWGSVDLLTSHFCIESATADLEKWQAGIKNICNKVSNGGFLLMTAIRNAEWYQVGENRLPAVPVDAQIINIELEKNGFKILEETEMLNHDQKPVVGYDGMVFILAQKV